jgi:UrcA family protein
MDTKTAFTGAGVVLGAAIGACTLFASGAAAGDRPEFTVAYQVDTQGLDLNKPAGARELYSRLKHAADVVCTHGMRIDLAPPSDPKACYEQALGQAVRLVKRPLLTQIYLETHTLGEAAARGIDVPVQLASK